MKKNFPKECEAEWIKIMQTQEQRILIENKVLEGIPDTLRSLVWKFLIDTDLEQLDKLESIDYYYGMGEPAANKPIIMDVPRAINSIQDTFSKGHPIFTLPHFASIPQL